MERVLINNGASAVCEVIVGAGSISAENLLPERSGRRLVGVLYQPGAADPAERARDAVVTTDVVASSFELPDREEAKTLLVAEELFLFLNASGMTRQDTLIAVGGGAATDVGGFVGATYLRGVETVLVPTTLLAAVDAAIGGKSGLNVGGKNLAGVFRHPARVVIDTDVLAKLPRHLLIEGTAEAVKAGLIADIELVRLYQSSGLDAPIDEVVGRAIKVKADVVGADFTEQGRRAILNYGHTVGHAIEFVAGIPHGHAVAIGMVAAGEAAERLTGFSAAAEQRELLSQLELPVISPPVDRDAIEAALLLDKKRDAGGLRMVLLESMAQPTVRHVDMTTVRAALSAVGIE